MIKGKNAGKNEYRHSIKRQFAAIFIIVLAATFLLCWLINSFFLEDYYVKNKTSVLFKAYSTINAAAINGTMAGDEFAINLQRITSKYNIELVILDADTKTVTCTMNDPSFMTAQLLDRIFDLGDRSVQNNQILSQTDSYTIEKVLEQRTNTEYIGIWGVLDNGNMFMLRIAIESIKDSVAIANRFLMYIGLAGAVISGIIIWLVSRKITEPIKELSDISEKMSHLDFEAKYSGHSHNEIGKLGHNVNVLSDTLETTISELKTANNELRKDIAKKEEVDEMRKEFLSNVSHELKTPIALIQGYAEGLQEGISEDQESRDYYCSVIVDEANKMNTMVKQLLTLNQLEFGNDNVTMERFDIVALVRNYIQSADILVKQHEAKVTISQSEPVFAWGDEFKIEEVVMNYFTNALNHLDEQKMIVINFKACQDTNNVRVSVFNTGQPIPADSLPHLFEKFYKVDRARTRAYGGSGVGLSIVKAIMDSMHHKFGVNNYDNGVEFWFELEMDSKN